jgi:endonuclease I/V8-like Glu-specific endopeptidase
MATENLSNEIAFVSERAEAAEPNKPNGGFETSDNLAFEATSTGVLMQLDGLDKKNLISIEDAKLANSISPKFTEAEVATGMEKGQKGELSYEAILGERNDILPIWFLGLGTDRAKSICLINTSGVDYKDRKGSWQGTGFLVSPSILLTNYHVLNSKDVCENAICIFNYQTDEKGKVQTARNYQLNPKRLFITSPEKELDFCFVWIDQEPGKEFGYIPLVRHAFVVKEKDFANIIQHPGGKIKSIALQNNQIVFQNETIVHYTTDTLAGSSGAVVTNNEWKAFALHHATRELEPADVKKFKSAVSINEGIKLSAIATYLESINENQQNKAAAEVLALFADTDAMLGYFGGLGREKHIEKDNGLERVVQVYSGEAKDIDIAFWNIEWFNKHYRQKIEDVGKVIVRMNMDVWVFEESSPKATQELVTYLKSRYDLDYDCDASEPDAPDSKQTTTIIWNTKTVAIEKKKWSEKVEKWLALTSHAIQTPDDLVLESNLSFESVDGKIFDRYPGLFYLTARHRDDEAAFSAYVVPLHLKAMGEGSKRRVLASKIMAAAIQSMIDEERADQDWILGGDFNATLASEDFTFLLADFTAISAEDEKAGEMTYIKGKYKSLIDHIFLSPNLKNSTDSEFIIVAQDKVLPDYLSISDHRPVLIRLSLKDSVNDATNITPSIGGDEKQQLLNTIKKLAANRPKPPKSKTPRPGRTDVQANLAEVERNRNREYYNETEDAQKRRAYYGDLPSDLPGDKFYDYLNKLVTQTHRTVLPYNPKQYLYPWVDLQPDKKTILNIYSGDTTTPEALIRSDFESEQTILEAFYQEFPSEDGFESNLALDEELYLESLESNQTFNCEHVVPQSWFGKKNPMKGDLHHLYSCTPVCNSFRGNIPYYEYPDWEEKVMDNCGNREERGFEPKEGKGKVARATLYFLIRYPQMIARYNRQDIQTLLAWHINEPPTVVEKHRNVAIQELQGNRNPFIDFPRLATKVDFSKGLK